MSALAGHCQLGRHQQTKPSRKDNKISCLYFALCKVFGSIYSIHIGAKLAGAVGAAGAAGAGAPIGFFWSRSTE